MTPGGPDTHHDDVTVVVLAGGSSTRFGGDKLAARLGSGTVLGRLLAAVPDRWPVVVVGAPRDVPRRVTWALEEPPHGGPLAGVAAGLAGVQTEVALVVAGDMPYAGPALPLLLTSLLASPDVDAAVAVDENGCPNPLLAAYRVGPASMILAGPVRDRPARDLLRLGHVEVAVPADAARDIDTRRDLPPHD